MIEPDYMEKARQQESAYQKDRSEKNLYKLMCALMLCGEKHFHLNEFEDAKSIYQEAAKYAEMSEYLQTDIPIQRELADCYLKLGDACRKQMEIASSGIYYEKAMHLRQKVMDQTNAIEDCGVLCICFEKAGGVHRAEKRLTEAQACFEKSLRLRRWIVEKNPTDYHRRALAASYGFLGNLCRDRNDYEAANGCYKKELHLCQQLVADSNTHPNREVLALSHYKVATTLPKEQRAERKVHLQKSYELFTQLSAEAPEVKRYRHMLTDIRFLQNS